MSYLNKLSVAKFVICAVALIVGGIWAVIEIMPIIKAEMCLILVALRGVRLMVAGGILGLCVFFVIVLVAYGVFVVVDHAQRKRKQRRES